MHMYEALLQFVSTEVIFWLDYNNINHLSLPIAFYLSFVITPFCSNASELVSSLIFASKKKKVNSSLTFSQVPINFPVCGLCTYITFLHWVLAGINFVTQVWWCNKIENLKLFLSC